MHVGKKKSKSFYLKYLSDCLMGLEGVFLNKVNDLYILIQFQLVIFPHFEWNKNGKAVKAAGAFGKRIL